MPCFWPRRVRALRGAMARCSVAGGRIQRHLLMRGVGRVLMKKFVMRASGALLTALVTLMVLIQPPSSFAAQSIHVKQSLLHGTAVALVTPAGCDPTQWHFIINQIDTASHAPGSIVVVLENINTHAKVNQTVPLDKTTTGVVAHYSLTSYLTGYALYDAYTSIYNGWDGEFNLSCPGPATTPPPGTTSPPPCNAPSNIQSNFNGTVIPVTYYVWFNSVLKVTGAALGTTPVTINVTDQHITSSSFSINVPDAAITFSPTATSATTTYSSGKWITTVPASLAGSNSFMSGVAYAVPLGGIPAGLNPVTWHANISTTTPGLTVNWQWAAAVYTQFNTNYGALGIKPVDANNASAYTNSDHAGTPESYKSYLTAGARGGGGSNYTGSYSGTGSLQPCLQNNQPPPPPDDTPELDSLILFGMGGLGLGGYIWTQRRRRTRQPHS